MGYGETAFLTLVMLNLFKSNESIVEEYNNEILSIKSLAKSATIPA